MPKIFTYDQQSQTPEGGLTTKIEDQSAVGDALEKLGQQGEGTFGEIAHENNQDAAKRADLALTSQGNDVLYTGDGAFMGLKGDNAQLAAQPAMAQLKAAYEQAGAGLNPAAKEMFDQAAQPRLAAWQAQVNQHLIDQRQAAMNDVSLQRQQLANDDAARNAVNDPALADDRLQTVGSEAWTRAVRNGANAQNAALARNDAMAQTIVNAAAVQIPYDPERVPGLLADHRGVIASSVVEALSNQATGEAALTDAGVAVKNLIDDHTRPWAPAASALPPDAVPAPDPRTFFNGAVAKAGDDPDRQAVFGQEAMARLAQIQIQRAADIHAATAAAQPYLSDPEVGSLGQLPTLVRLSLPATTRAALIRHYAAGGHPQISDFETRADLYDLLANAPERFADLDLTGFSTGLSKDDYATLIGDQAVQRQGGPQAEARRLQVQTVQGTANRLNGDLGVTEDSDPSQFKALRANLLRSVDLAQARDPDKPLTADAVAGFGRDLIATGAWNRMEGKEAEDPRRAVPTTPFRPGPMANARYFMSNDDDDAGRDAADAEAPDAAGSAADAVAFDNAGGPQKPASSAPKKSQAADAGGRQSALDFVQRNGFAAYWNRNRGKLPPMVKRADWEKYPVDPKNLRTFDGSYDEITLHHTGSEVSPAEVEALHRGHEPAFHKAERELKAWASGHPSAEPYGFGDVGYNFLIGKDGKIYEGRDLHYDGAHVRGHNAGNLGVAFLGDYSSESLTGAQMRSAQALINQLSRVYNISGSKIFTHADWDPNRRTELLGPTRAGQIKMLKDGIGK